MVKRNRWAVSVRVLLRNLISPNTLLAFIVAGDSALIGPNLSMVANEFEFDDLSRDSLLGGRMKLFFFGAGIPTALLAGCMADRCYRWRHLLLGVACLVAQLACIGVWYLPQGAASYQRLLHLQALTGGAIGYAVATATAMMADSVEDEALSAAAALGGVIASLGVCKGCVSARARGGSRGAFLLCHLRVRAHTICLLRKPFAGLASKGAPPCVCALSVSAIPTQPFARAQVGAGQWFAGHRGPTRGWRYPFIVYGAIGAVVAVLRLFVLLCPCGDSWDGDEGEDGDEEISALQGNGRGGKGGGDCDGGDGGDGGDDGGEEDELESGEPLRRGLRPKASPQGAHASHASFVASPRRRSSKRRLAHSYNNGSFFFGPSGKGLCCRLLCCTPTVPLVLTASFITCVPNGILDTFWSDWLALLIFTVHCHLPGARPSPLFSPSLAVRLHNSPPLSIAVWPQERMGNPGAERREVIASHVPLSALWACWLAGLCPVLWSLTWSLTS